MTDKEKEKSWATATDVARLAGVSRSAVSRAFTPGASVSDKTRARIMRAAEQLGYQVDYNARNMIQGRSSFVGVVTSGLENPFRVKLLSPLAHHLGEQGFLPILMDADDADQIAHSLQILLSYRIAGVIMTSGAPPLALAREYVARRVPVAMLNRAAEIDGVDVVNSDNETGGRLAAQRLVQAGGKRFAFVGPHLSNFSGKARCEAFVQTLRTLPGRRGEVELCNTSTDSYESGQQAAKTLLDRSRGMPDAVFCATDMIALGFIDAARQRFGRSVPEDLMVIGFDDIPHARMGSYRLTTIAQNVDDLAREAVDVLVDRMTDFTLPTRTRVVPVSLVERDSAGPVSG
ncbi:LacI family DNA-binding transcriptional regulator [Burkholderia sp. AU33545]|uniref:LacI family DNA-binding transcriptional regulator n=1 Tax=Burkholderia sp. AU33545 TaxID=2879631 RepID=UPI001CF315E8|nr:LacI family DNA-binding transcriptional regulator [Burkholderia sp. AU33545]MCA8205111.1 LacI family DNA-binding transcriptional regulator [Burkholderia sp. AU33545]